MLSFSKVKRSPNICGIEIAFSGNVLPSNIPGYQPFFNSIPVQTVFNDIYHGKSTVSFSESSKETSSGTVFSQQLTFRFPSTDDARGDRMSAIFSAKWIKIRLTNNQYFFIGRNDYFQNTKPVVKYESSHNMTNIQIETQSMFPVGFIPDANQFGLPAFIPVSLTPLP